MVGPKLTCTHIYTHTQAPPHAQTHQECDAFFFHYLLGEIDL